MTKVSDKEEAIRLRKNGYSYNLIAEKVSVSKSTLSLWLAKIPYSPNKDVVKRIGKAHAAVTKSKHEQKLASFREAEKLAKIDIGDFIGRDLFMLGLALYIGEGEKNDNVGVINADPRIIRTCIRWLRKFYDVPNESFTLAIHLYPDNNVKDSLEYWSRQTGLPLVQFGKTQIDKRRNKRHSKRSKLPYGTAHLRVRAAGNKQHGVLLSRRIQATAKLALEQEQYLRV
ncbi:hypothetical protein KC865_03760 [Candidatus Kaiserbacteria bacterium]|nr:hypothetical protein [Candidatus Kaiserbacteria bacterium]USN92499.1 MAG: hypothetical protein H6782_01635 [Candidatus Nomurabacteria bacterium]